MPPTIANGRPRTTQWLSAITMRVGSGSWAPSPSNIAAKVGMTFHRMTVITMAAMARTEIG